MRNPAQTGSGGDFNMTNGFAMERRALLQNLLLVAGAASTAGFSEAALAKAAKSGPRFLDRKNARTLSAIADTIMPATDTPGAVAAGVLPRFDAMLANWASPATRELVLGGIARLEAAAREKTGKSFAALSPADRKAFLVEHDKASLAPVPPPPGARKAHPFAPLVSVADNGYQKIKALVIGLYYTSEAGLTQELIYEHVPGGWTPSIPITPGMHPYASGGPI